MSTRVEIGKDKTIFIVCGVRLLYGNYVSLLTGFYVELEVQVISIMMSYFKRKQYWLRVYVTWHITIIDDVVV